jgi:hypothetical protein
MCIEAGKYIYANPTMQIQRLEVTKVLEDGKGRTSLETIAASIETYEVGTHLYFHLLIY